MTAPAGWAWAQLGDVVDVLDHLRVPVNRAERADRVGPIPYYGATGQVGWIDRPLFNEELCLLGEDGAPFFDLAKAKAYVIDGPSWVNNHAHVLRARDCVTTRFLKYALDQVNYRPFVTGTTRAKLTKSAMSRIPVPIPPLAEQRRIVEAIEELVSRLDSAGADVRSAKVRIDLLRRSVLDAVVADGRDAALDDLLIRIEAGRSAGGPAPPARADEWGVIKVSAMTWGEFRPGENKRVAPDSVDPRHEIRAGDLLVSRANTTEYVGAAVLVRETRPRLVLSDKSLRLVTRDGVDREWLLYALLAPNTRRQISAVATGTSDSMRNISQEKLRAVRLRVPEVSQQRAIAAEINRQLAAGNDLAAAADGALQKSAVLRRCILAQAFQGALVPQDANDEPATVLLERITAERDATLAPTRRRRERALT